VCVIHLLSNRKCQCEVTLAYCSFTSVFDLLITSLAETVHRSQRQKTLKGLHSLTALESNSIIVSPEWRLAAWVLPLLKGNWTVRWTQASVTRRNYLSLPCLPLFTGQHKVERGNGRYCKVPHIGRYIRFWWYMYYCCLNCKKKHDVCRNEWQNCVHGNSILDTNRDQTLMRKYIEIFCITGRLILLFKS
jgi:hypothetical protein